ncbi:MAG: UDP-glucose/GDP-mannose dehydrogenase family protein [Acidimicrobiaceae bacterium]|nr:UDP-glucose/GDP-mannose dehydrogenase family protein [Acidimicrobiaceae bacterium]MXW62649.1 UDP-glucose/GDP-mannose dehydrogenase family protein [Acidimicrobiaceae bacterium]MXW74779.1 UDP-glucose/GDP-mannose dehydrogenase family protein [Acidimicrobiaceae bacterium]MYA73436.1 UDP-glucose/GDP-mannose dehydrogenase family protein [Acidimicrobiaceae bacterium]MYC42028.1 UDP-glucose/GDP-mannose dehydrogenase family protein [Acidimicrobiaceae bacterium]
MSVESRIAVIGTGYVGLTTGACFAHLGHDVVCADIDVDKVRRLQKGDVPIHEAGLEELVREGLESGRLSFVVDSADAVGDADFVYLCVPTPQSGDGSVDLKHLKAAAAEISAHIRHGAIVVNKSTVPVGSTLLVEEAMNRPDIAVVSNPEFLREGTAVTDFLSPDRVVIGADDPAVADRVADLHRSIGAPVMITDPASAETIKYAANAFLATKLSFVNTIAAVCEAVGADVGDVLAAMGLDKRIGGEFLVPGPGWGGSCFPKDTRAIISMAEDAGYDFSLMRGVLKANDEQFKRVVNKAASAVSLNGSTVALLGLAFKAGTDDTRNSPALEIAGLLLAEGAKVRAYDPAVATVDIDEIVVVDDPYAACEGAAVLVVATEWDEFRLLDLDKISEAMVSRHVVDARNILDREALLSRGFTYQGIGRN